MNGAIDSNNGLIQQCPLQKSDGESLMEVKTGTEDGREKQSRRAWLVAGAGLGAVLLLGACGKKNNNRNDDEDEEVDPVT